VCPEAEVREKVRQRIQDITPPEMREALNESIEKGIKESIEKRRLWMNGIIQTEMRARQEEMIRLMRARQAEMTRLMRARQAGKQSSDFKAQ
jgi:hypothetical protein